MTKEQQLLFALLGKSAEINPAEIDWGKFVKLANSQSVIPLIFQALLPFAEQLPAEVLSELESKAQTVLMQNLVLNNQLLNVHKLLQNNNIEYLAYKGSTLAQLAYQDLSLRQFGDLDILIHQKDFPQVKKIILENGGKSDWDLTEKQEKAVLKYYYEFPMRIGENGVLLEIHWAFMELFFCFDYEIEGVFKRKQTIEIYGNKIPTLSNEDLLIVLCVHGSKHFWKRLSWICDVGKLIQNQPINWKLVIEMATEFGSLRMLKLGLLLAADLMKIELPNEIKADQTDKNLAEELKNQIFDERFSAESIRVNLHLKMRERLSDKIKYSHRLFKTKLIDSLFLPMGRPQ